MAKLTVGDVRDLLEEFDIYSVGGLCHEESIPEGNETFSYTSPLGEDFGFTLWYEDNAETLSEALDEYAKCFDPEDHADQWYRNRFTVSGIPSLADLIEDAKAIKQNLLEASKAVNAALDGKPYVSTGRLADELAERIIRNLEATECPDGSYELVRDYEDEVKLEQGAQNATFCVRFKGKILPVRVGGELDE